MIQGERAKNKGLSNGSPSGLVSQGTTSVWVEGRGGMV